MLMIIIILLIILFMIGLTTKNVKLITIPAFIFLMIFGSYIISTFLQIIGGV